MTLVTRHTWERCGMCQAGPGEACSNVMTGRPLDWFHLQPEGMGSTEIRPEHRALSAGRLATPERNHTCPACKGAGALGCDGLGLACCPRCAGTGERKANREPADHAFPAKTHGDDQINKSRVSERDTRETPSKARASAIGDRALRQAVSSARKAGKLGAR